MSGLTATALAMLLAIALDAALGEPRRGHPLVAYGRLAAGAETWLNRGCARRARGVVALLLLVVPPVAAAAALAAVPVFGFSVGVALLYACIGHRSLREHARRVAVALQAGDLPAARARVGAMVSRDPQDLDAPRVAAAATESVLENGNDAVFGALFWFAVAGAPGALAYRLVNTLDAMWGYRTPRLRAFGWAAARLDDALNYVPARLTALSYAVLGDTRAALRCWRQQAPACESPNGGPVMSSGAGSLGLALGGGAHYRGVWKARPALGAGAAPDAAGIERALRLVARTLALWLLLASGLALGGALLAAFGGGARDA
ncbi:adenosylcobinamide-phosphate synthase CbiB [Solimonas flava]|uniref:adenosylcobinamide-phosphate synthase CbiB n=1 Tax=Solimonas flava TaxID=415849 RepID=UPI0003F8D4AE|nr:adenosylcobinamide-phosphate synthase CbiB [Solimonas flava]